ncbi:MAG TPA: CBS domain-containing protein, partial [Mycobacterium sp.]|nr:CBS domain-containing protein [Mycobacterium sp.]
PDALLSEVAARLSSAQISVVVVSDAAGAAVGVITETILVRRLGLGQADFFNTRAGAVMTSEFTACAPDDLLSDVLAMMHTRGLVHVLILGANQQPLGVLNAWKAAPADVGATSVPRVSSVAAPAARAKVFTCQR